MAIKQRKDKSQRTIALVPSLKPAVPFDYLWQRLAAGFTGGGEPRNFSGLSVVVGEIVFITVVFSLGIGIDWNVTRWYMLGLRVISSRNQKSSPQCRRRNGSHPPTTPIVHP
jgi:hypothetical protein